MQERLYDRFYEPTKDYAKSPILCRNDYTIDSMSLRKIMQNHPYTSSSKFWHWNYPLLLLDQSFKWVARSKHQCCNGECRLFFLVAHWWLLLLLLLLLRVVGFSSESAIRSCDELKRRNNFERIVEKCVFIFCLARMHACVHVASKVVQHLHMARHICVPWDSCICPFLLWKPCL
jgi:hypothetical protein